MKLTKESVLLMSFFSESECLKPITLDKSTLTIIHKLYGEIKEGYNFIHKEKEHYGKAFYNIDISVIHNINQIPKPATFPANAFPDIIRDNINKHMMYLLTYTFHLYKREIQIFFILEGKRCTQTYKNF